MDHPIIYISLLECNHEHVYILDLVSQRLNQNILIEIDPPFLFKGVLPRARYIIDY